MKSLLINSRSNDNLKKLNESEEENSGNNQYILEGVFAELDTLNRNQRIYPTEEYLKHLTYLRKDIENGEHLLGELDHPDDRFETKMANVSHEVVDLYYDSKSNCVMGKIRLLDTPCGKIAKAFVDDGVPLHISSRSAGEVDEKTHKVKIYQIYTYDLVAKPGFANAVLHRVNESEGKKYSPDVIKSLRGMEKTESLNVAPQYGFVNENLDINEVSAPAKLRKEVNPTELNKIKIDMSELEKHIINEENAAETPAPLKPGSGESIINQYVKQPSLSMETNETTKTDDVLKTDDTAKDVDTKEDDAKDTSTTKEEDKKPDDIEKIECVYKDEKKDKKSKSDVEDIEAVEDEDSKKSDSEKEKDEKDEKSKEDTEATDESCKGKTSDNKDIKYSKNKDISDSDLKKRQEKLNNKIDELLEKSKNKKAQKESVVSKYPFAQMFTEQNFEKFNNLCENSKIKVSDYLRGISFVTPNFLNESWQNAFREETTPIWLKYAPSEYRDAYDSAPDNIKKNISESAEYIIFENQNDIDTFWENSGVNSVRNTLLLESYVKDVPEVKGADSDNQLPYSLDVIEQVAESAEDFM